MNAIKTASAGPSTRVVRYSSLDGLRGVAALVVVVHHCMLVNPTVFAGFQGKDVPDRWIWWWTYSPLHMLWAGSEAVTVFFVLSGFVLTLPFQRDAGGPPWRAYYPQRLLRIYLPVAVSLFLATVTYLMVDHHARPGMSWWMASHDISLTPAVVGHDALLVLGAGWLNSVLWSLRWEVLFSLVLPVVLLVALRAGRYRLVLTVGAIAMIAVVELLGVSALGYMLMFCVGSLMAAEQRRWGTLAARVSPTGWAALLATSAALLLAAWWPSARTDVAGALSTVGAALLVAAFLWCPAVAAFGEARPMAWLGTRSFSLYLVHEPIVTSTALLLGTDNPAVVLAVALPASLLVTAGFFRLIEGPSHRLARSVGRMADASRRRREVTA